MLIEDTKKPNLDVLREFRIKGVAQPVGSVIPKTVMPKGDWMNLCAMKPPRAEQTAEKVGPAKKTARLPGE